MMVSSYRFLRKHRRLLFLYGVALIIRLAFAIPFIHDWDGFVFSESAKNLLNGETPYQTVIKNDPSIYPDSDKPMIQQWYAYPPLPLLMFTTPLAVARLTGLPLTELTETLLLKLPFIFGDLLAAWLVKKFLEDKHGNMARRAELLVLFNPLLIWVSSAWGMFDIWMANFLLLFLLALRKQKVIWSGLFLVLACTTKLFPVFFLPAIAIYVFNVTSNPSQRWRLTVSFILTLSLIVAPFFLSSPRGFLNQNLLMHLQRPTQGLSIPAIHDHYRDIYQWPDYPVAKVAGAVMYLTMLTTFIYSLVAIKRREENLIWAMIVIYTAMLVLNKVTNEQYFVLLVVLLIVLIYFGNKTPASVPGRILMWVKNAATYGVLIAASLLGFHFLGFLLPGLTRDQFRSSTNNLVFYLSRHFNLPLYSYPDSALTYYNLPMTIASIAMVPFLILGLWIIWWQWQQLWEMRKRIAFRLVKTGGQALESWGKTPAKVKLLVVGLALAGTIAASPVKVYMVQHRLLEPVELVEAKDYRPLPENPRVGTFYNVWWNNFSHYKDFPYGDWDKTTLTPAAGYYTSKNSYIVQHIKQMKQAGIDFAIIPYHLYDRRRYLTFGEYAEKLGFYYAPMVEIYDVLAYDWFRPVGPDGKPILGFSTSEESRQEIKNVIVSSLADVVDSPAIFRIEGKPVVFLFYGHWFIPSWDKVFKEKLAVRVADLYKDEQKPFASISRAWGVDVSSIDDLIGQYPSTIQGFNQENRAAADYKLAFINEYEAYWSKLIEEIEGSLGPVFVLSTYPPFDPSAALDPPSQKEIVIQFNDFPSIKTFDGEFFYGISSTWYAWQPFLDGPSEIKKMWEEQIKRQAEGNKNDNRLLFLTVTPFYNEALVRPYNQFEEIPEEIDGVNTYDWGWETALWYNPDYVLITSWNEFFEGTAIEPSVEHGDEYVRRTAEWVEKFKNLKDQDKVY